MFGLVRTFLFVFKPITFMMHKESSKRRTVDTQITASVMRKF